MNSLVGRLAPFCFALACGGVFGCAPTGERVLRFVAIAQSLRPLKKHDRSARDARVEAVAASPTGSLIATTGETIRLWSTTGAAVREISVVKRQTFVVFSPDGAILAGCSEKALN